jgi:hypothetical protein
MCNLKFVLSSGRRLLTKVYACALRFLCLGSRRMTQASRYPAPPIESLRSSSSMTSLSGNQLMSRNENLNFELVPAAQAKFRKITNIRTTVFCLSNKPIQQKHQLLLFIVRVTILGFCQTALYKPFFFTFWLTFYCCNSKTITKK